jgi:uncharacterized protein (DUF305 family)
MPTRRSLAVAILVPLALAASACSGGHDAHSSTPATTTAVMKQLGVNGADVTFAQMMIPHHEQAIEMAELALDPKAGAGAEVRALATAIRGAQDPEIATMKGWLTSWGAPLAPDPAEHDMSTMQGMMSADEMRTLGQQTGSAFDKRWLEMMIRHHEGAIVMANDVKAGGSFASVKTLAAQIVTGQQAEIDQMRRLLAGG